MLANRTGIQDAITASSAIENGTNYQLASNRFNQTNTSIFFNSGYVLMPQGVYFDGGDFTIIMWVKTTKVFWQSLVDFGDQNLTNNVIFQLDHSIRPNLQITVGTSSKWYFSSKSLILNQWNHMVATLNGMLLKMYLNGMLIAEQNIVQKPMNLTRPLCFLGRSNDYWRDPSHNPDAVAYIDGVYIYNRALNETEILGDIMNP